MNNAALSVRDALLKGTRLPAQRAYGQRARAGSVVRHDPGVYVMRTNTSVRRRTEALEHAFYSLWHHRCAPIDKGTSGGIRKADKLREAEIEVRHGAISRRLSST
jgi:hypothetical protein